jgi:prepilin-type processing-associated H-X9-DG protein
MSPTAAPKSPEELLPADAMVFARWGGIDAHRGEYEKSALHDVIEKTSLGKFAANLLGQIQGAAGAEVPAGAWDMAGQIWQGGAVLAVNVGAGAEPKPRLTIVFPGAANKLAAAIEALAGGNAERVEKQGRKVTALASGSEQVAWWAEGEHLVFTLSDEGPDAAIAVAAGSKPNLTTSDLHRKLAAGGKSKPILNGYVDIAQVIRLLVETNSVPAEVLETLGVNTMRSASFSMSFVGRAIQSEMRLDAPAPRKGLAQILIDQPKVGLKDLPGLPASLQSFTLVGCDWAKTADQIIELVKSVPGGPSQDEIDAVLAQIEPVLGVSLRDLLGSLGNKLVFYSAASGPALIPFTNVTLGLEVRKPETVRQLLDKLSELMAQLSDGAAQMQKSGIGDPPIYMIRFGQTPIPFVPTMAVSDKWLVAGLMPQSVQSFLSLQGGQGQRWAPDAAFTRDRGDVPTDGMMIGYSDPRPTITAVLGMAPMVTNMLAGAMPNFKIDVALIPAPDQINQFLFTTHSAVVADAQGLRSITKSALPGLSADPATIAIGVALLLPAVQQAREAARRTQDRNNLKQIGLAMHNYHDVYQHFPIGTVPNEALKPDQRLSWMASVLPFVEQNDLYNRLDMKKGWHDAANEPAVGTDVDVFLNPSVPTRRGANNRAISHYAGMAGVGEDAPKLPKGDRRAGIFGYDRVVGIRDIIDGTANTVAVMDVKENFGPWVAGGPGTIRALTKEPYINGPDGIGSFSPGGANFLFADGSVRFISQNVDANVMRALATMAGQEAIGNNDF